MNKLDNILKTVSDEDLKKGVDEIKNKRENGILEEGFVKTLARRISEEVGVPFCDALNISERTMLEAAAFKWAENCLSK